MKIIDLLNKIANGNIPKRIIYNEYVYQWNNIIKNYEREVDINTTLNWDYIAIECLNEEVEIIEEENKKCTVETCCIGIEELGKTLLKIKDDMKSIYENIDKDEILEEEKKIPEKLKWNEKSQHNIVTDNTKKTLEHLLSRSEQLKKSINEIIDYLVYLKSKGE